MVTQLYAHRRVPKRSGRQRITGAAGWFAVWLVLCQNVPAAEVSSLPVLAAPGVAAYGCRVIEAWDHSPEAFTQGLVYFDGYLYESTGLRGASSLRKIDLETGRELKNYRLPGPLFAEGMTIFNNRIYQLTWTSGKCLVYGVEDFDLKREFSYEGQGWGLTHDSRHLIMSDGSHRLRFIDPETFATERVLEVFLLGRALSQLNELEYIEGEVYANVWQTNSIARIDPASGKVVGLIDVSQLAARFSPIRRVDVANGIAYDSANRRLLITGKLWPKLFRVAVIPLKDTADDGR